MLSFAPAYNTRIMAVDQQAYQQIIDELSPQHITLVAVSKTKPVEDIRALYNLGQRDFGENYVQELVDKQPQLPNDIRWHFIGHLQSNKVKYMAGFVHLIHGVDSFNLLKEINKQAAKFSRSIDVLLQVHIAREETKFGLDEQELAAIAGNNDLPALTNTRITGLMGMASFTGQTEMIRGEFNYLRSLLDHYASIQSPNFHLQTLSMGMSSDYRLAIEAGSNMVRIGSLLFGARS